MTTSPKIRYQIEADATGSTEVEKLARELDKLDGALDPALAQRAQEVAARMRELGAQSAAVGRFVDLKAATQAAAAALTEAQAAAQKMGRELAASEAPTRAQQGQMTKLREAVRAAAAEHQASVVAVQQQRQALAALGVESEHAGRAQRLIAQEQGALAAQGRALVGQHQQLATAAEGSAARQVASHRTIGAGVASISAQLQQLQTIASAAIGGQLLGGLAGDLAKTADAYSNLQARIKLVTGEGAAFDAAFQGVQRVALSTNTSLEATGQLFTRVAEAGKLIGVSAQQALGITETINQAVQLSGSSAEASNAAVTQLIQGLQSGVLRGEEFNSVMEQAPRLSKALADALGVTTGQLREQAQAGSLTADVVIKALQTQSSTLKAEFATLPPTVGRALENLQTSWSLYIGEADKANGVSAAAASAITLLAQNLDTVGKVLFTVGEAWLAYKALDLAGTFLRQGASITAVVGQTTAAATATAAHTAATIANTAATTANTAAKGANVAATTAQGAAAASGAVAAAAGIAKLAGPIGLAITAITLFGDLAVKAFKGAGTWIGEAAAKLAGYKDRSDELEISLRAQAEAAAKSARQAGELAAKQALAEKQTQKLSEASLNLVNEFVKLRRQGESTSDAIETIGKKLRLGDVQGINDAINALQLLERQGKISADRIQQALSQALDGRDLEIFKTNALAAFDTSAKGAETLKAAINAAIGVEALRRAGTSVEELKTGFSTAMRSAVNDIDAAARQLVDLGIKGEESGRVLEKSFDKALATANTEKAVQKLIERLEMLRQQGLLTFDQYERSVEQARRKTDDLKTGVNSVAEAYRVLGLKAPRELQRIADSSREAWRVIRDDATSTLAAKQEAFRKYAAAAIEANNGVASETLKVEAQMLGLEIQSDKTGRSIVRAMGEGRNAVSDLGVEADRTAERLRLLQLQQQQLQSPPASPGAPPRPAPDQKPWWQQMGLTGDPTRGSAHDKNGWSVDTSGKKIESGTYLPPPDNSGDWTWVAALNQGYTYGGYWEKRTRGSGGQLGSVQRYDGMTGSEGGFGNNFNRSYYGAGTMFDRGYTAPTPPKLAGISGGAAPAPDPAPGPSTSHTVTINLGGRPTTVNLASAGDASTLTDLLRQLETAAGRGG